MCAKRVISEGFGREKGGIKANLGPRKPEKSHFFARGKAGWRAERDFRARSGHYAREFPRPEDHPGGNAARATDEKPHPPRGPVDAGVAPPVLPSP